MTTDNKTAASDLADRLFAEAENTGLHPDVRDLLAEACAALTPAAQQDAATPDRPRAYCLDCQSAGMSNCAHFNECSGATCITCHRPLNSPNAAATPADGADIPSPLGAWHEPATADRPAADLYVYVEGEACADGCCGGCHYKPSQEAAR